MKSDSKIYRLTNGRTPLTCMIATKHSRSKELTWLDEVKKENRALREICGIQKIEVPLVLTEEMEIKDGHQ